MKKIMIFLTLALLLSLTSINAQANLPKMFVSGFVGYHHPLSDFADFADRGLGVAATLDFEIMPNLYVYGMLGYTSWTNKTLDEYSDYFELKLSEIPIKAGAKYFLSNEGLMPYVGAELGYHMFSIKYEVVGFNLAGDTESENEIGFAPLAGLMLPISDNIYFNGCVKYTIIKTENYYEDVSGSLNFHYLSIFAGVSIGL